MSAGSTMPSLFGSKWVVDPLVTITFADLLSEQAPRVTVTLSVSVPAGPAWKVMERVPAPAVIAPPEMDQLYVAPLPASATEAVPLAPEVSVDGAVMVASGTALIVTA